MTKDLIYILSKHVNYKGRKYDDYRTVRNISVCKDDTYFSKEDYKILVGNLFGMQLRN